MRYLLVALASFLIGGIPFGYLLAKLRRLDVRRFGSGNIGATNVLRSAGPVFGVLTLILDAAKGFAPAWITARAMGPGVALLAALFAVLGHTFSPYLGFRGGKGVATGFGSFLALTPVGVAVGVAVWLLVVALTGYASLGSMLGTLALVAFLAFTRAPSLLILASLLVFILVVVRHRENIRRLVAGSERKVRLRKDR